VHEREKEEKEGARESNLPGRQSLSTHHEAPRRIEWLENGRKKQKQKRQIALAIG